MDELHQVYVIGLKQNKNSDIPIFCTYNFLRYTNFKDGTDPAFSQFCIEDHLLSKIL